MIMLLMYCLANWSQNILFKPPASSGVGTRSTCVVLSARDQIVPSAAVRTYLAGDPNIDLVWFDKMRHGQIMLDMRCLDLVKAKIDAASAVRAAR